LKTKLYPTFAVSNGVLPDLKEAEIIPIKPDPGNAGGGKMYKLQSN
jgi:hypothetical protein